MPDPQTSTEIKSGPFSERIAAKLSPGDIADLKQWTGKKPGTQEYLVDDTRVKEIKGAILVDVMGLSATTPLTVNTNYTDSAISQDGSIVGILTTGSAARPEISFRLNIKSGTLTFDGKPINAGDAAAQFDQLKKVTLMGESASSAPHVTTSALVTAEKYIGEDRKWNFPSGPNTSRQVSQTKPELSALSPYLESIAQVGGVDEINAFLKKKGSSITLRPVGEADLATASALDIKVKWKDPGSETEVKLDGTEREVAAAKISTPPKVYEVRGHQFPVVELQTQSGERFFVTQFKGSLSADSASELATITRTFADNRKESSDPRSQYPGGIIIPMVDYSKQGDNTAILGGTTTDKDGKPVRITQAVFQHRLKLDHIGAHAQAEVAVGMARGLAPAVLRINGNFIAWIEVPAADGKTVIPFSALITPQSMRKPPRTN